MPDDRVSDAALARLSGDELSLLVVVLARAASPEERLRGGWLRPVPSDEAAHVRYRQWAARVTDGDEHRAADILAARGLTPEQWRAALGDVEVDPDVPAANWPEWARGVLELVTLTSGAPAGPAIPAAPTLADVVGTGLPDWVDGSVPWRFYAGFAPWWQSARRLVDELDVAPTPQNSGAIPECALTDAARADLALTAVRRLLAISGPRLMVAAETAQVPLFSDSARSDWLRIFAEFPVLARLLAIAWLQWRDTTAELIARIRKDRGLLAARTQPEAGAADSAATTIGVRRLTTGEGDAHAGGRSVAEVEWTNGEVWFLKPRNSGGYQALSAIFAAVSAAGKPLALQLPDTIERDGYCWVRKVRRSDCKSAAEVATYFFRAGVLARVLQALGATDLHHENFIPAGDQPVLIDLETVFGPGGGWQSPVTVDTAESEIPAPAESGIQAPADPGDIAKILADTPAATSMISSFVDGPPGHDSVDIGALAGPAHTRTPYEVASLAPTPNGPVLRRSRVPMVTGEALPTWEGHRVSAREYVAEIVAGYCDGDQRLRSVDSLATLLAEHTAQVRYVARPTQVYSRLLAASLSPTALGDGVERALVIERLWRAAGSGPSALITAEAAALQRLDVPMFTTAFDSTDLLTDTGERIPTVHAMSPRTAALARWAQVRTRTDTWDDICAALFALHPTCSPPPFDAADPNAAPVDPAMLLMRQAVQIGASRCAWLGVDYDPSRNRWRHQRLGPGLLGEAGVGLALVACAALRRAPADPAHRADPDDLATMMTTGRATLLASADRILDSRTQWASTDAFAGPAGTMYALARAHSWVADEELRDHATSLLPAVVRAARGGSHRDLLDARAGGILALLWLAPTPQVDEALAEIWELLVADLAESRGPTGDPGDRQWLQQVPSLAAGRALAAHRISARSRFGPAAEIAALARAQWLDGMDLTHLPPGDRCVAMELGLVETPPFPTHAANPETDYPTRDVLDDLAVWLSVQRGQADGVTDATAAGAALTALAHRLSANRNRDGAWFTDVIVTDHRNFSAIHGLAAVTIGTLATHPDCPHVRVLA